jgi:hypothetical protein
VTQAQADLTAAVTSCTAVGTAVQGFGGAAIFLPDHVNMLPALPEYDKLTFSSVTGWGKVVKKICATA